MVWINWSHCNRTVPDGMFGGSRCICPKCREARGEKPAGVFVYCNRCHWPVPESAEVCMHCGNKILDILAMITPKKRKKHAAKTKKSAAPRSAKAKAEAKKGEGVGAEKSMRLDKHYSWKCKCGRRHKLDFYAAAHYDDLLTYTCACRRKFNIKSGVVTELKKGGK